MLRSIGRALGDVAVDGGAEKVCEPRLPKLPPRPARASASLTASASTATSAQMASSGRKAKRDIDSSQETTRFDLTYWWSMTAFKEVPHGVAEGPRIAAGSDSGAKPWRYPRLATAWLVSFAASQVQSAFRACGGQDLGALPRPPPQRAARLLVSVVLAVFARLSQRQCAVESVVAVGIDAQPLGRRRQATRR